MTGRALGVWSLLALAGCREPTSIELRLSTDVKCSDEPTTTIFVSRHSITGVEPTVNTSSCQSDGTIGSLVVVPASSKDELVHVQVVSALKGFAAACAQDSAGPGCIVSRRRLRFFPHSSLVLPIAQQIECLGVSCGASDTCRDGSCVPEEVDIDHCKTSPKSCGDEFLPGGAGGQSGAGGQGGDAGQGGAGQGGGGSGGATLAGSPRPIRPLSFGRVTSQTPRLTWELAPGSDGVELELCRDRACTKPLSTTSVAGTSWTPPAALDPGLVYWRLTATTQGVKDTRVSPTWVFGVGHRSAPLDSVWGVLPDIDGDGFADVLVGARGASNNQGAVQIFRGSAGGLPLTPTQELAVAGTENLGVRVVPLDLNGDGFLDLVTHSYAAVLYVYLGSAAGLPASPSFQLVPPGSVSFRSTSQASDVNGDGYADLIVGNHSFDSKAGGFHVVYGQADPSTPVIQQVNGANPAGQLGYTVAGLGDMNGDGFADVAACSPNGSYTVIHLGSASGVGATPAVTLPAPSSDKNGCVVSSAGDVNGDGYLDMLTSGFDSGNGRIQLTVGGELVVGGPIASGDGGSDQEERGFGLGDLDGDGYADTGLTFFGSSGAGFVTLAGGGPGIVSVWGVSTPSLGTMSGGVNDYLGESMAAAGDINGDGIDDAVLGARGTSSGAGSVYVVYGVKGGSMLSATLQLSGTGTDVFGGAVALGQGAGRGRAGRAWRGAPWGPRRRTVRL